MAAGTEVKAEIKADIDEAPAYRGRSLTVYAAAAPELMVSGKAVDKLPAAGTAATVQAATNVKGAKLIAAFYNGNKLVSVKTFTEKAYTVISGEITVPAGAD